MDHCRRPLSAPILLLMALLALSAGAVSASAATPCTARPGMDYSLCAGNNIVAIDFGGVQGFYSSRVFPGQNLRNDRENQGFGPGIFVVPYLLADASGLTLVLETGDRLKFVSRGGMWRPVDEANPSRIGLSGSDYVLTVASGSRLSFSPGVGRYNLTSTENLSKTKKQLYAWNGNKLSAITDPYGRKTSITAAGAEITIAGPLTGSTTTVTLENGAPKTIQYASGAQAEYTFDTDYLLREYKDVRGAEHTFAYDADGVLLEARVPGIRYTYTYDPSSVAVTEPSKSYRVIYSGAPDCVVDELRVNGILFGKYEWQTIGGASRMVSSQSDLDSAGKRQYAYETNGLLKEIKSPEDITTIKYDPRWFHPTEIVTSTGSGAQLARETTTYQANGIDYLSYNYYPGNSQTPTKGVTVTNMFKEGLPGGVSWFNNVSASQSVDAQGRQTKINVNQAETNREYSGSGQDYKASFTIGGAQVGSKTATTTVSDGRVKLTETDTTPSGTTQTATATVDPHTGQSSSKVQVGTCTITSEQKTVAAGKDCSGVAESCSSALVGSGGSIPLCNTTQAAYPTSDTCCSYVSAQGQATPPNGLILCSPNKQ